MTLFPNKQPPGFSTPHGRVLILYNSFMKRCIFVHSLRLYSKLSKGESPEG